MCFAANSRKNLLTRMQGKHPRETGWKRFWLFGLRYERRPERRRKQDGPGVLVNRSSRTLLLLGLAILTSFSGRALAGA